MISQEPRQTAVGQRQRTMRRGIVRATTNGLHLAVAGASGVGAALLGSWPILALGGAAYAALVAWDLANPRFWATVVDDREVGRVRIAAAKLPAPDTLLSNDLRRLVLEIARAGDELSQVNQTTPAEVTAHLGETFATVAELEQRAALLLERGDVLHRYLVRAGVPQLRASLEDLRAKLAATSDREAKAQYARALDARMEHWRTLEEIASAEGRIVAHVTRLAALLASLPAKVVHLRALDAEAMDRVSGDMKQELESFNLEISSFEETLKTLAEVPST
jgi:hypothetical protein